MSGLIGKKIGMTSIFDENGKNIPCTIIEAGPCVVTQVRTKEVDGYDALQLGFDDKAEKRATKAELGHFKKAGSSVKKKVIEFQGFEDNYKLGDTITVDFFAEGEFVDVSGISKGNAPTRFRWGRTNYSRSAQPTKSSGFCGCFIIPFTRIQRYAYGGQNGCRESNSTKLESIKSGS